jgi:hypothetical protein
MSRPTKSPPSGISTVTPGVTRRSSSPYHPEFEHDVESLGQPSPTPPFSPYQGIHSDTEAFEYFVTTVLKLPLDCPSILALRDSGISGGSSLTVDAFASLSDQDIEDLRYYSSPEQGGGIIPQHNPTVFPSESYFPDIKAR